MSVAGFELAVLAIYCKSFTQVFFEHIPAIKAKGSSLPTYKSSQEGHMSPFPKPTA
jgi:hypothetical protein